MPDMTIAGSQCLQHQVCWTNPHLPTRICYYQISDLMCIMKLKLCLPLAFMLSDETVGVKGAAGRERNDQEETAKRGTKGRPRVLGKSSL